MMPLLTQKHLKILQRFVLGEAPRCSAKEFNEFCRVPELVNHLQRESANGADLSSGYILTSLHNPKVDHAAVSHFLAQYSQNTPLPKTPTTTSEISAKKAKMRQDLDIWMKHFQAIESVYNGLNVLTGCSPESPLSNAMYELFVAYTIELSHRLGDDFGWLDWFVWENDCGKADLKAKASSWTTKKERRIKTLDDLCDLILADLNHN